MSVILTNEHRARIEEFRRKQRTGILVLLFTDMVGSTRLKQDLGDQQAVAITQQHHAMVRELLARFPDSKEIDTAGDSFFLVFVKPSDAVKFALLMQSAVRKLAVEIQEPLADRIGIHAGEVFMEDREGSRKPLDLFGIQVDSGARVMSLAEANQILTTRFVFDNARQLLQGGELATIGPLSWLGHGPYLLKGVEEPLEICEVGETGLAPLSPPADSEKARRHAGANADQVLGWRPALQQLVPNTQWLLERKLGEGGFGEVWLARHKTLKEKSVFKFCFHADRVRSLKREVTIFKLLRERVGEHPGIVGVRDVFFEEPPYYIVMEYAEGADLVQWVAAQGGIEQVPLTARLEIVAQLAEALQAAHEAGIIHRDVKPSNIIVCGTDPGRLGVKLTDFGIGRVISPGVLAGMTQMGFTLATNSGSETGTPLYMAPELLAGKPASTRSDIYALGIVLYQLLIGDLNQPAAMDWARTIESQLLRDDLAQCLAGNPQERFVGAQELAQRLRTLPERRQALARREAEIAARERAAHRRGMLRAAAFAAVVVLVMAVLATYAFIKSGVAEKATNLAVAETTLAEAAKKKTEATLSAAYMAKAVSLIPEQAGPDALAYLTGSLRENPANKIAMARLVALLSSRSWWVPARIFRDGRAVQFAQFSPDGTRIVTVSEEQTRRIWNVKVWDARSGSQMGRTMEHADWVNTAQFSPDGQRLVTTSDSSALVWDARTGERLAGLKHAGLVLSADFSRDGRQVMTASENFVWAWDLRPAEPPKRLLEHKGLRSARFSPDGRWIVTASSDETARVWDAQTGKEKLAQPLAHKGSVKSAKFSPDGQRIVTASDDYTAQVWEADTGRRLFDPLEHTWLVWDAQFSPDGKRIVTASWDRTARVWDAQNGQPITEPLKHNGKVRSAQFSPGDGKRIITASADGTAQVWGAHGGQPFAERLAHRAGVLAAEFSPDGERILTTSEADPAQMWDAHTGRRLLELKLEGPSTAAHFSEDGKWIVTAAGNAARIWDAQTGQPRTDPMLNDAGVSAAQFSPDGKWVVTVSGNNAAAIWNARDGRRMVEMKHAGPVRCAQFSPDGRRLITAWGDNGAQVWDARSGEPLAALKHDGRVSSAQFSPDGTLIVTASFDSTAQVWDAQTGKSVARVNHEGEVLSAEFSPDGKWIVTASADGTARVWDAQSGDARTAPMEHKQEVKSAQFSRDGRWIITVSDDKTARVWDAQNGQPLTEPLEHDGPVKHGQFSRDGKRLVTASDDHTARVWDLAPAQEPCPDWLVKLAKAISGQELNNKEGCLQPLTQDRAKILDEIQKQVNSGADNDEWTVWGRWFLADPLTRTISPFSKVTVPEYIEDRIQENTTQSLDEAERAAYGSGPLLERIAVARKELLRALEAGRSPKN